MPHTDKRTQPVNCRRSFERYQRGVAVARLQAHKCALYPANSQTFTKYNRAAFNRYAVILLWRLRTAARVPSRQPYSPLSTPLAFSAIAYHSARFGYYSPAVSIPNDVRAVSRCDVLRCDCIRAPSGFSLLQCQCPFEPFRVSESSALQPFESTARNLIGLKSPSTTSATIGRKFAAVNQLF